MCTKIGVVTLSGQCRMAVDSRASDVNDPGRRVCVTCPSCQAAYKIAPRLVGRRLVCKSCRHEWRAQEVDPSSLSEIRRRGIQDVAAAKTDPPSSAQAPLEDSSPPRAGAPSVAIDTSLIGRTLGRYRILSILGQGGMGVVWRGHDDVLNRDVAIKLLSRKRRPQGDSSCLNTELFMQEARAVAKLQHPAVVSIFEIAEDESRVFFALELMEGGTLKEYIDQHGKISPARIFDLMIGPAKALALAHKNRIIHRDVKPGNLMFDDHGHLKLMDFGLADVAHESASKRIRGKAVGSLGWIAPETAKGQGTTGLSDIFSFGLVMLYAMTGSPPIHADSRSKLIELHQNPTLPKLEEIPGLTAAGAALLRKCLDIDPAQRFASADELAAALERVASEDPQAKSRQRRTAASIAISGSIIGALLGTAAVLWYFIDMNSQIDEYSQPMIEAVAKRSASDAPSTLDDNANRAALADAPSPEPKTSSAESDSKKSTPPDMSTEPVRYASLEEAKVPWPRVPYLLDIPNIHYVASRSGAVFHLASADCGRSIYAANLVIFETPAKAVEDGRRPCPRCKPDAKPRSPVVMSREEPEE
ncbi:Serine/threonine-protein kinase PrkC [Phycisphaerae bacterium RAS2]|nr:Serine/threonine-protein kinase PrkC [Phycisphaerae bacterium RAS2]